MKKDLLRFEVCSIAILCVLLAFTGPSLDAQTSLGTVAGVVSDPQGAVIPNATVTVVSDATGEKHTTRTNAFGAYRIESVGSGPYTITVRADKFSDLRLAGVVVTASVTTTVNANLTLGVSETVVTVETTGEQLHTEDGAITHNISSTEIQSIPIGNLNPISLVLTEPGVVQPSGRENFTNGVGFSVNGTRPRANNFLIEGFDNNDAAIQGQALQVTNLEATKEVSILTNSYNAEFGHGGGSVTNLLYKSGSNAWHGSVFDLIQNSSLDANNASNKINGSAKPKSRENTYGFTVGGPIKHDKIFVFGSIQWDKQRQGATGSNLTVPTANGFATLQGLAGGNPRLTNYLSALGNLRASSAPGTPGLSSISLVSGPSVEVARVQRTGIGEPSNDAQYVAKGDWQLTANDTITLRYTYDKNDLSPDFFNFSGQLPCCDTQQGGSAHNGGLAYTHAFTPKVINEFRASYGRIGFTFGETPATLANPVANGPTVTIAGLTGFGAPGNIPQGRFHNTFQYQDSVSWLVGNHSFKFGADIARILVRDAIPFNSRGTLAYAAGNGSGLANFIDDFGGSGGSANLTFGSPIIRPRYFFQNYFAQDTWKLRPNFTLSIGIRYENAGTPENTMPFPAVDGHIGVFDASFFTTPHPQKSDNNNFAPRLSFAYTPRFWSSLFGHEKTVIRAGFGTFYDNIFTNIVDNSAASSPNAVSKSIVSTAPGASRGTPGLSSQFSALTPAPTINAAVTSITNNIIAPETYQWNFDIERELGANFVLTTSYVGTRGVHLLVNDQFNPINPTTGLRMNPAFGPWTVRDNGGDSMYHALDVKLDRRFSKGLLLRTSYTFSKLIDTGSEVFTTTGNSSFPENLSNRALDRGLSAFDRRHRLVVTYVYDIPKLRNDSNFAVKSLGYVVNGWQIAGTAAYQTGAPYTVSDGVDQNGDGTASDRPSLANLSADPLAWAVVNPSGGFCDGPTKLAGKGCVPFLNGTWDQHASANPANWTGTPITASNIHWLVPAAGTGLGTLGRNTFNVPGRQDWTFGLQRTINLHSERHQLVFRTEMLNPFNHPNTGNPLSTNLSGVSFFNLPGSSVCSNLTTCPSTTPAGSAPAVNFLNTASTIIGERDIRFWLKYQF